MRRKPSKHSKRFGRGSRRSHGKRKTIKPTGRVHFMTTWMFPIALQYLELSSVHTLYILSKQTRRIMQRKPWEIFWRYHSEYLLADPCLKLHRSLNITNLVLSAIAKLKKRKILHASILTHVHTHDRPFRIKDDAYDEQYYHFIDCTTCANPSLTLPDFLNSLQFDIAEEHNCSLLELHEDICIECRNKPIPILGTEKVSTELTATTTNRTPLPISLLKETYTWDPIKNFSDFRSRFEI